MTATGLVGYHGTSEECWESITSSLSYRISEGDNHWLGSGVYFFLESIYSASPISDAANWAKLASWDNKTKSNTYQRYVVIENEFNDLIYIWDLSEQEGAELFRHVKEKICEKIQQSQKLIKGSPSDGIVINFALNNITKLPHNAVRNNLYIKLTNEERQNRIRFSQPNCTVLCVRDISLINIKGKKEEGELK